MVFLKDQYFVLHFTYVSMTYPDHQCHIQSCTFCRSYIAAATATATTTRGTQMLDSRLLWSLNFVWWLPYFWKICAPLINIISHPDIGTWRRLLPLPSVQSKNSMLHCVQYGQDRHTALGHWAGLLEHASTIGRGFFTWMKDKRQFEKYEKFSLYHSCVFYLQSCWLYIYYDANWPTTPTASRVKENRHRQ